MRLLKNKPIQRKVTLVIQLTCSAALLLMAGALLAFQLFTFRLRFTSDLTSLAAILNQYAVVTVRFKDKDIATEMLRALKGKIVGAEIVLPSGEVFAGYGEGVRSRGTATELPKAGLSFDGPYAICAQPLIDPAGNPIGWLYLCADYNREFWALVKSLRRRGQRRRRPVVSADSSFVFPVTASNLLANPQLGENRQSRRGEQGLLGPGAEARRGRNRAVHGSV